MTSNSVLNFQSPSRVTDSTISQLSKLPNEQKSSNDLIIINNTKLQHQRTTSNAMIETSFSNDDPCDSFLEQCQISCCCCVICIRCIKQSSLKRQCPVFGVWFWILNSNAWIAFTGYKYLTEHYLYNSDIQIFQSLVALFTLLLIWNAFPLLFRHSGLVDYQWKLWDGKSVDKRPYIPKYAMIAHANHHKNRNHRKQMESCPLKNVLDLSISGQTPETIEMKRNKNKNDCENQSIDDFWNEIEFCDSCQHFKPPRTHHCHRCDICISKMDHHCIWLNKCIGYDNHRYFIQFLMYYWIIAILMFIYSLIVLLLFVLEFVEDVDDNNSDGRKKFEDMDTVNSIAWDLTFVWNFIVLACSVFILVLTSKLLKLQYFLLCRDISFVEYLFYFKETHGQYSKGGKMENLKFYLGPTIFHFLFPIFRNTEIQDDV